MTKTPITVQKVFTQIKRRPLILEDRREYCAEDLKLAYELTDEEAVQLFNLIQAEFK